jgi:LysM repeat protein
MTVNELKRLNGLRTTQLKTGQRLALTDPYQDRNPLLLPGDSSEDEVLEMAYSTSSELEQVAFNYLSTPYRFGGSSRKGIDCSAFVQKVFREVDVDLPRSAREQFRFGDKVEREDLQKGDLIFFRTYAKFPSHVGIYLGDGKMIHASSRSRRVVVTSIDHPYYRKRFIGAKRISLLDIEPDDASGDEPLVDETDDLAVSIETAAPVETLTPVDLEPVAPVVSATSGQATAPDAVNVAGPATDAAADRPSVEIGTTLN